MLRKLLIREGFEKYLLPFEGEGVDLQFSSRYANIKVCIMYFGEKEIPWIISWYNAYTKMLIERNRVATPEQVLKILKSWKEWKERK